MMIPSKKKRLNIFSPLTLGIRKHGDELIAWKYSDRAIIQNDKVIKRMATKGTEAEAQNLTALRIIYWPGVGDTKVWLKARNSYLYGIT